MEHEKSEGEQPPDPDAVDDATEGEDGAESVIDVRMRVECVYHLKGAITGA